MEKQPDSKILKWATLMSICQTDETMNRVVHWRMFADGVSSALRRTTIRKLKSLGWSAGDIAKTLGLSRRLVWAKLKAANGTLGDSDTRINHACPGYERESPPNYKPSTKTKKGKRKQSD